MIKDKILIDKTLIPYDFDILLADEVFNIGVDYNEKHDLFTIRLSKDNKVICEGEPIVYGMPLFRDMYIAGKFPAIDIIPLDISGEQKDITYDNFGETIFLTIDNAGGEEDE